ncbi:RAP domain-containing protein [Endozoicomonas acroporae]|uniref:RAP domain-containing protein n=1 Tax=Endozoicomonas acroporae TaxID=1701104 RepID=UPI0013D67A22|nr:RAP domain-containing protein [Endozoicomonas acroporae]
MDRSSAGISGQYTRSNNSCNQPNGHTPSSGRGRYRHATVRQWDTFPRTAPGRNEFYQSSGTRSSQHLQCRSVNSAQDFNALIKPEIMADLVSKSNRYGHRYDGRNHGQYASSIKKYTSAAKRPLNRTEQSQLMRLLQNFTATRSWNWRSLTTTLHSFTSAGVFTLHKPMDERVKLTQANLLSTLLDAIIFNCNQKLPARDIATQAVANLLWAMAKLVNNGQERTPEFNEAVVALLHRVNAQKADFKPQEIANLLWAMAKLMDNGQEQTPEFNEAVSALLPHVNAQKDQFIPQHIANLLWAMAKLVGKGLERTPSLNKAVAVLLPQVNAQQANYNPQEISNLLWAMAELVDSGLEQTPELKDAVAALLPHVNIQKDQFIPQAIANLLWAMAKLVDNGVEGTPKFKEAVAALLPLVNVQKGQFIPQHIANLLWAMAKLVDNGQEPTPGLKEAVAALLPSVNAQKDQFNAQDIANLLWAMAKLVDNGYQQTPEFNEAVAALLTCVIVQKANFNPQEIANLLWAMTKLVDNGQEQTPGLNEAVVALLSLVNVQKDQFKPQGIANLLWATAKLGELVELKLATSTFESLVYRISEKLQFSQEEISMSLWGVMVCCARLSLDSNANKNNVLEKHMDDLFTRLENTFLHNEEDQRTIVLAASWLGRACPVVRHYQTIISKPQSDFRAQLQSCLPSLKIEEEKSLNSLPPVDLLLPDHNIVIEVQGPYHYVGGDFTTRNGSTLLKIALLQKAGFEVIEIPANRLLNNDLMKPYIDQIKIRIGIPPQGHDSVSLKRGWTDAAYVTGEEHLAEQTNPAKRKKTNNQ